MKEIKAKRVNDVDSKAQQLKKMEKAVQHLKAAEELLRDNTLMEIFNRRKVINTNDANIETVTKEISWNK